MTMILAPDLDPLTVPAGSVVRGGIPYADLADGQAATFPLIVVAGAKPGPTAALVAGIHGDEFEGPAALWQLAQTIQPKALAGRLLIVPVANLSAFSAGTRTSPIDLQNLARIFPGDAGGTVSFRLAHALLTRVVERADFLVDCHSGGVRLAFLDVAGFYGPDADIPVALSEQSLDLAKDMSLSQLWRLPARHGVLSYEAMRRGIPATGGEIGGRGGCLAEDARSYHDGILRILARRGMIETANLGPAKAYSTCLVGDWALAPAGGFLDTHVSIGQRVMKGELLATLSTPLGETIAKMAAGNNGLIMGVRHLRSIQAGEWATCVVEEHRL